MSLTPDEAAQSLKSVTEVQRQSRQLYGYRFSAPFFFVWGLVWVFGYSASAVIRDYRINWIWLGLILAGIVAHSVIARSQIGRNPRASWRNGAIFGVIFAFTIALFSVMHPRNALQVGAYWPLLFAAIYTSIGMWAGPRYVVAGVVLFLATLIGYFFLPAYFFWWMAAFGGGTLILTGVWMRRA